MVTKYIAARLLWLHDSMDTLLRVVMLCCCTFAAGGALAYAIFWQSSNAVLGLWLGLGFLLALLWRRYMVLTVALVVLHLYVDWYLGLHIVAPGLALGLVAWRYVRRRSDAGWTLPRLRWLWLMFLLITIYPCWRGGVLMLYDAASFYPSDILGALMMFWLGTMIAHTPSALRVLFTWLTVVAVVLALHMFVQALTGVVLFGSARVDQFLAGVDVAYYQLAGSNTHRIGSFFIDPNWAGAFFALMFFLPLGLFVWSAVWWQKIGYLGAAMITFVALIVTYSTGAWVAFFCGMLVFWLLLSDVRYQIVLPCCIWLFALVLMYVAPAQLQLQMQHATGNNELSLRIAAWHTALRVIAAYPWTGVGLGHQAYLLRSEIYRVPEQFIPLSHPHDSYLEWAAMGGLPVLAIFLLLLLVCHYHAWQNWRGADRSWRPLFAAGIASTTTLSVNSISINGWTHFALAFFGWLILGAIAAPRWCKCPERP